LLADSLLDNAALTTLIPPCQQSGLSWCEVWLNRCEQNLCRDVCNFCAECVASSGHSLPPQPRKDLGVRISLAPHLANPAAGLAALKAAGVNFDTTKPLHSDRGCGVETQAILKAARRIDPHVVDAVAEFIKDPDAD
jgi:hypothetical protein